ncbi:MAG: hypothetical protein ACN2B6_07625 [Rickettsiales bacterium]
MAAAKPAKESMTKEEFQKALRGSLLVLTTSSPDKRDIYRELFSAHAKEENHQAGLDIYYTDSGALGIAPRKTPEQTGDYGGNLDEKALQQMQLLEDKDIHERIRHRLKGNTEFDSEKINIVGMTEDSGWTLIFDDKNTEKKFIEAVKKRWEPQLREQDKWMLKNLDDTGFPGPNLKPIQEHMPRAFDGLMQMIYDAADEVGIKDLRFRNSTNVSFVFPATGQHFQKTFHSDGRVLTRDEYHDRLLNAERGEAINSNFVHVPDGQKQGEEKTVDQLISAGIHHKSIAELPADYARRELTEYLQELIGKRKSSPAERKRPIKISIQRPELPDGRTPSTFQMPEINDLMLTSTPSRSKLLKRPNARVFGDADAIVLVPDNSKPKDQNLTNDPNLAMLFNFVVTAETDPAAMAVPIILDNRSGGFDKALELGSDAFAHGRLMGDRPYVVANTDDELRDALVHIKDIKQRAPLIYTPPLSDEKEKKPLPPMVPNDGTFTVFIGGGHANNSKRDLEDAKAFGYYAAEQGWRIVTGGGSVEGSMGATHTGFVQYHLDQLEKASGNEQIKASLEEFKDANGHYDAEKVILEKPAIIEELADKKIIPRDMFYAYNMEYLLTMESPSGEKPPGITYYEAGNRTRRLVGLLSPGNKVFMPGGIGTDEEFEETIRQHIEARQAKTNSQPQNDNVFPDGTPDDGGTIILYNRDGALDKLLETYGLSGNDTRSKRRREKDNIVIVTSLEELKEATKQKADSWLERVQKTSEDKDGQKKSAAIG